MLTVLRVAGSIRSLAESISEGRQFGGLAIEANFAGGRPWPAPLPTRIQ